MTLSIQHEEMLQLVSSWCRDSGDSSNYLVFEDVVGHVKSELPPAIDSFRPDVAWVGTNGEFRFIGEAKTIDDLPTAHTRKQLSAFLRQLDRQGSGQLIVAVPWGGEGTANSMLTHIQTSIGALEKRWKVISDAPDSKRTLRSG